MLLYFVLFSLFISCSDNPQIELSSVSKIESFNFHPEFNGSLEKVATSTISKGYIIVSIPYKTSPEELIATFDSTGASILVGGKQQISGVTVNNFSEPVVYRRKWNKNRL